MATDVAIAQMKVNPEYWKNVFKMILFQFSEFYSLEKKTDQIKLFHDSLKMATNVAIAQKEVDRKN